MIQTRLDDIQRGCAEILVKYGNSRLDSQLRGTGDREQAFLEGLRPQYLCGIIKESYLSGSDVYVGSQIIPDNDMETILDKMWHYNRNSVDLSIYSEITPDDGDSGSTSPETPTTSDNERVGSQVVSIGANPVTFLKNGIASALSSADYTVFAYLVTDSGYQQNNVNVSGKVAGGFTVNDILEGGTLYYHATLNT